MLWRRRHKDCDGSEAIGPLIRVLGIDYPCCTLNTLHASFLLTGSCWQKSHTIRSLFTENVGAAGRPGLNTSALTSLPSLPSVSLVLTALIIKKISSVLFMQEYFPRQYTLHPRRAQEPQNSPEHGETPMRKCKDLVFSSVRTAVSPLRGRRWKHSSTLEIRGQTLVGRCIPWGLQAQHCCRRSRSRCLCRTDQQLGSHIANFYCRIRV